MRLSDCFAELMAYIVLFRESPDQRRSTLEKLSAEISRLIAKSAKVAQGRGFSDAEYEAARFAVCAWIDEVILGSSWSERNGWLKEQLQRRYYHTFDAGEEFFLRLQKLEPRQRGVREVFLLCLGLGFTGRYCSPGDAKRLDQLKELQWQHYSGGKQDLIDPATIFPELYQPQPLPGDEAQHHRRLDAIPKLVGVAGAVLVFLLLFFVFKFTLDGICGNILRSVP